MARRSSRSSSSLRRGDPFLWSQRSWPPAIERLSINEELDALRPLPQSFFQADPDDDHLRSALYFSPAKQIFRSPHRNYGAARVAVAFGKLQMLAPRRVLFCLRRKVRREVLFAFGRTGKGSGPRRGRRVVRTQDSQYRC